MCKDLFNMIFRAERMKLKLIKLACKYGRANPRVLAYSRRLDKLIAEIQKRKLTG